MIIGLGTQGLFRFVHLRWDESLQLFKQYVKGNWIQEFVRAIDIYMGKVKGFKDVPEEQLLRQETMKAELKLLIRTIITDQLEKWAESDPAQENQYNANNGSDDDADILESLDQLKTNEKALKYRTLIRIAIEFCVTI